MQTFEKTLLLLFIVITDYGHSEKAFFKNLELGLSRHFRLTFFEAFLRSSAGLSAPILVLWVPCHCFPLFNHYFYKKLQKTKPLHPTPKYLFGSGIWIWAAKNLRFSLRASVVRGTHHQINSTTELTIINKKISFNKRDSPEFSVY